MVEEEEQGILAGGHNGLHVLSVYWDNMAYIGFRFLRGWQLLIP